MKKQEFLALDDGSQFKYLNDAAATGKNYSEICQDLGMTKEELGKLGYYFVKDKWMRKPMKGYQTTKRSGNEYTDRFK